MHYASTYTTNCAVFLLHLELNIFLKTCSFTFFSRNCRSCKERSVRKFPAWVKFPSWHLTGKVKEKAFVSKHAFIYIYVCVCVRACAQVCDLCGAVMCWSLSALALLLNSLSPGVLKLSDGKFFLGNSYTSYFSFLSHLIFDCALLIFAVIWICGTLQIAHDEPFFLSRWTQPFFFSILSRKIST